MCEDVQCTYTVHVMIPIMKTGKNTPAGIGRATAMVVNTNYKKKQKEKLLLCFILYEYDKKVHCNCSIFRSGIHAKRDKNCLNFFK